MNSIIGDIIGLVIASILAPSWFSNLPVTENNDAYKIFFRLIYPKWISFKQIRAYNILRKKQFRHIRYERKRLDIGVMIRN